MPIYLPETTTSTIQSLTPRQIVAELDKYVVGQHQAKRAVAIALRNRMRRQKLSPETARRAARSQAGRDRRPREILSVVRDHRRVVGRGSRHQRKGHAAWTFSGTDAEAPRARARGARRAPSGRGAEADRHGQRGP